MGTYVQKKSINDETTVQIITAAPRYTQNDFLPTTNDDGSRLIGRTNRYTPLLFVLVLAGVCMLLHGKHEITH